MKESINLFLKLSEDTQNKLRKIYIDDDLPDDDIKIFDKLFSKVNLCKNIQDLENESPFKNYRDERDITIGDILFRKNSDEIGTVENFEDHSYAGGYDFARYANVIISNGHKRHWALNSTIELINKYCIGTSVLVRNVAKGRTAWAIIRKVYCLCKSIYYDVDYIKWKNNIHLQTKCILEDDIIGSN